MGCYRDHTRGFSLLWDWTTLPPFPFLSFWLCCLPFPLSDLIFTWHLQCVIVYTLSSDCLFLQYHKFSNKSWYSQGAQIIGSGVVCMTKLKAVWNQHWGWGEKGTYCIHGLYLLPTKLHFHRSICISTPFFTLHPPVCCSELVCPASLLNSDCFHYAVCFLALSSC